MLIRSYENHGFDYIQHQWVVSDKISNHLKKAVIGSEDQLFFTHSGFDFQAIKAALQHNRQHKNIRGGSTISQQTAKNVFLWPQRSWPRKILEAWFTVLIELMWSKERILEVYLNSIEMGQGVFGAQAAAQHWFKVDAINLTAIQSAAIASILPNPNKYKATKPDKRTRKRQRWIRHQMRHISL